MSVIEQISQTPTGRIIALNVSLEVYEVEHAPFYREYVEGYVVDNMTGATLNHNAIVYFIYGMLDIYFALRPLGQVIGQPYQMRLPAFPNRRREPDLMVVLNAHQERLHQAYILGAPDICIEVVSVESSLRDTNEKLKEYEAGGVPEYWLIDPTLSEATFYRLDSAGVYQLQPHTAEGWYRTPTLPNFALPLEMLWRQRLPSLLEAGDWVRSRLAD